MCYICAMNVQNDRSYAKESTKTSPSGVRFDKEQLEFIQKKELKLTTKQKVVDFLLNKYWWENKVAVPNHKGLPPEESVAPESENKAIVAPIVKTEVVMPPKPISEAETSVIDFEGRLRAVKSMEEGERIMKEVKSALLTGRQKQYLEAVAKEVSENMF